MAELLPIEFPQAPSIASASYDFQDIAEGTGVQKFFLAVNEISGAVSYGLHTDTVFSTKKEINVGDTNITFSLSAFNLPKAIRGTAYLNCTLKTTAGTGSIIAELLNDVTGSIVSASSQSTVGTGTTNLLIPLVVPETHFRRGEILQLKITDNSAASNEFIGTDPQNRDGTNITPSTDTNGFTNSALYIPFKLEEVS